MNDKELYDLFHAYRPELSDDEAFMEHLSARMDAVDEQQRPRVRPLFRRALPWAAGIAASVAIGLLFVSVPQTSTVEPPVESRLPEAPYYRNPMSADPFSSYDDIVSEIEQSGRQLEQAIAQL